MRVTNLSFGVIAVCVALMACKKDKDKDKDKGEKSGEGKTTTAASAAPKAAPAPPKVTNKYQSGDVLKYMPKECTEGRIFLSISKLIGSSKQSVDDTIKTLLTGNEKGQPEAREALELVRSTGLDPTRDLQEVAVCAGYKGQPVVALGLHADQIKSGDVLDLLQKATLKVSKQEAKKETKDGVSYLVAPEGKPLFALVSPTVIVVAEDMATLTEAKKGAGKADFADAASQLAYAHVEANGDQVVMRATPQGNNIDLAIEIVPKGKKPEDVKIQLEQARARAVKEMKGSPLEDFTDDAKKVTFAVEGAKVVARLTIARSRLDDLFKKASTMKPEELMRAF